VRVLPEVVTEIKNKDGKIKKAIDFEKLKTLLTEADEITEPGDEKHEFTWVGKKESMVEANKSIRKTLGPCKEESKDWDNTENLFIEGDRSELDLRYGCLIDWEDFRLIVHTRPRI